MTTKGPTPIDYFDTAMMLVAQNRLIEAGAYFEKAILLKPSYAEAWGNRGNVLHALGNHFDAILNYNQAIAHNANMAEFWNNRGATWVDLRCIEKGLSDYAQALKLNPKLVESHNNRGNALKLLGRIKEARAEYCKALQINPDYVDGRLNKSIMDLEHGDFVEGFKDYESRWRSGQLQPRGFPCPNWEGEDLNGKRLLLWAEQGLGDAVQFVRFASQIKKLYPYTKIAVEVRGTLAKLCSTVPGVDEVVEYGENPREADYACAMLSAPRILKTTMESIPAPQRYMWPSPYRIQVWRDRIKTDLANLGAKMLIGICWSGQSRPLQPVANSIDARRSTALAQWQPLALPGVVFVSLQTGAGLAQVKTPPVGMTIADFSDNFDDFADTAALMECLDLIISVDTAVPHVAAACGRPVWMLSRFDGCWRWRQKNYGDWNGLFEEVSVELKKLLEPSVALAAE